jgi:transposase
MQFVENLADRQAAEAVRMRIDWKCAPGLAFGDQEFDLSILREFRGRLLEHRVEARLFDSLPRRFTVLNWLKAGRRQCTGSTHVLGKLPLLNQLELVGEAAVFLSNHP